MVCIEACFGELAVSPDRGRTKAAQDGKGIKVIRKDRLRRKGMTTIEDVTVPREGEEACKEGKEEEGGRLVIKYESVHLQVQLAIQQQQMKPDKLAWGLALALKAKNKRCSSGSLGRDSSVNSGGRRVRLQRLPLTGHTASKSLGEVC